MGLRTETCQPETLGHPIGEQKRSSFCRVGMDPGPPGVLVEDPLHGAIFSLSILRQDLTKLPIQDLELAMVLLPQPLVY